MQELSLSVLDIAQNSVAAGATLIRIFVEEDGPLLALPVAGAGRGMATAQAEAVTDPFFTTRKTRKVGLGVPLLKMQAELTGGGLGIESKPGGGTTLRATFHTDSIDMLPLGDMAETVWALIHCNPALDFVYTRRRGERAYTLDTREARETLGGLPLTEPEVTAFLKDFLTENEAEIADGA